MSFDLTNDSDESERPNLPGVSAVALRRVRNGCITVVSLLFAFLVLWWLRTVYTDLLWFDELGYQGVFNKILVMKIGLFVGGTAVTTAALIFNF